LSYFTSPAQQKDKKRAEIFFVGIPMPAAAALALMPIGTTFELVPDFKFSPWFIAIYMVVVSIMMISRLPTFSFKKIQLKRKYVPMYMAMVVLVIAGIIVEPWIVLPFLGLGYWLMIPYAYFYAKRHV
jgi:CDP-diacylglycerol--serine O-phosphatidyltransferase